MAYLAKPVRLERRSLISVALGLEAKGWPVCVEELYGCWSKIALKQWLVEN